MNKYVPYIVVGIIIVSAFMFVFSRQNTNQSTEKVMQKEEEMVVETGPSPIPMAQVVLEDKSSVQTAIDAELKQIDNELSGIKDTDFNVSNLSDEQLGL